MNRALLRSVSRSPSWLRPTSILTASHSIRYESSNQSGILGWFRRGKDTAEEKSETPATNEEATTTTATQSSTTEEINATTTTTGTNAATEESDGNDMEWASPLETRTPGWMEKLYATPSETDIESINTAVQEAIKTHHRSGEAALSNWKEVPLRPLRFKYEVTVQAMNACHTRLPNRLLSNIVTGNDLAQALHEQAVATTPNMHLAQPANIEHKVARFYEEKVEELPPNLTFIKFNKQAKREVKKVISA